MELSLDPKGYIPNGLPPDEEIFVRIIPRNSLGEATECEEFSFRTDPLATLPGCASIIYPQDGELDVPLSPVIRWDAVDGADGYFISVGYDPSENAPPLPKTRFRIDSNLIEVDEDNVVNFDFLRFTQNTQVFIKITPYNSAGEALDCKQTSFFTFVECGPFYDINNELQDLSPTLEFPEAIGIFK